MERFLEREPVSRTDSDQFMLLLGSLPLPEEIVSNLFNILNGYWHLKEQ